MTIKEFLDNEQHAIEIEDAGEGAHCDSYDMFSESDKYFREKAEHDYGINYDENDPSVNPHYSIITNEVLYKPDLTKKELISIINNF